jgi:hypothetical protein
LIILYIFSQKYKSKLILEKLYQLTLLEFEYLIYFQALLFSFKHGGAIRRVIAVYKDWFQVNERHVVEMLMGFSGSNIIGSMWLKF